MVHITLTLSREPGYNRLQEMFAPSSLNTEVVAKFGAVQQKQCSIIAMTMISDLRFRFTAFTLSILPPTSTLIYCRAIRLS